MKYMSSETNIRISESSEIGKSEDKSPEFRRFFGTTFLESQPSASRDIFVKECRKNSFTKGIGRHRPKLSEDSMQIFTIDLDLNSSDDEKDKLLKRTSIKKHLHRKQYSIVPSATQCPHSIQIKKDSIATYFKVLQIKHRFMAKELFVIEQKSDKTKMLMKVAFKIEYRSQTMIKGESQIQNLTILDHQSFLRLNRVYQECNKYFLVFDFIEGITLTDFISHVEVTEEIGKTIIWQLLQALQYLHHQEIVHQDIRPQNIYVTNYEEDPLKLKIKIIDMSLLASVHDLRKGNNNVCGSAYFSSPESSNGVINCKYDIWSVGIIAIVLFSRFQSLDDSESYEEFLQSVSLKGDLFKQHAVNIPKKVINFINFLLVTKHTLRPSVSQALRHSWFNSVKIPGIASFRSRRIVDIEPYIVI